MIWLPPEGGGALFDTRNHNTRRTLTMENIIEGTDSMAYNRSVDSTALFVEIESLWPTDESGSPMPNSDVNKPALARRARTGVERLAGGRLPAIITVKLLNVYVACRRKYERMEATEENGDGRILETIENLASSSPYTWSLDVLEVTA